MQLIIDPEIFFRSKLKLINQEFKNSRPIICLNFNSADLPKTVPKNGDHLSVLLSP